MEFTLLLLCSILDGYSRFIVHWDLHESMTEADIEIILQRATGQDRTQVVRHIRVKVCQFGSLLTSAQSFGGSSYPGSKYDLSCAVFTRRAMRSTVAATPFCFIKWRNPCIVMDTLPGPMFTESANNPTKAVSPCWL